MIRLLAVTLSALLLALSGQLTIPPAAPGAQAAGCGGTLTDGQKDPAQSLDSAHPGGSLTDQEVFRHIYDGLVIYDEQLNVHPDLATSWSVSPDGLVWTFRLRRGVVFQDGTPFNAAAAAYHFERILDPKEASGMRSFYSAITDITTPDDDTISFHTKAPFGPFLNYMAHGSAGIVSRAAVEKWGKDYAVHPVGTGPYKFVDFVPGERVVLARNDTFWGGRPCFDQLIFRTIPDDTTRADALLTGEIDTVAPLSANDVPRLRQQKDLVIAPKPIITMMYIGFNLTRDLFKDPRVRQALSMAIDRQGIVNKILGGFARVADSPMAPGTFGYAPSPTYGYDPARAKALLDQAGWKPGPGGILQKDGQPLKFVLWTPQDLYLKDVAVAQTAQAELQAIGADVQLKVVDAANWFTTLRVPANQAPYDMFMWSLTPTTGDGYQQLYELSRSDPDPSQPPSDWNLSHYVNPQVDNLITLAGTTTDQAKRKVALRDAQRIIMHDAPLVFLYSLDFVLGYKSDLTGVRLLPNRFVDLREAHRIQ